MRVRVAKAVTADTITGNPVAEFSTHPDKGAVTTRPAQSTTITGRLCRRLRQRNDVYCFAAKQLAVFAVHRRNIDEGADGPARALAGW
jgi:hypothetical protein